MFTTMKSSRRGRALGLGLLTALVLAVIVVGPASGRGTRATNCAIQRGDVVTENTCYRWSHAGEAAAAAQTGKQACSGILSENSCYRWAHGGETAQAAPLTGRQSAGGCATRSGDVLTENSCYRFSHTGEAASTAPPFRRATVVRPH